MKLLIEARGPDLEPAGLVEGAAQATVVPRFNGLGSWQLTLPAASLKAEIREAWEAKGGIRILDAEQPDAEPIISGPLTTDANTWGDKDRYGGQITISGVSDERVLAARIVYPDPGAVWESQTSASHHTVGPAPAMDVIRAYVDAHAGPNALAARRWPGLTLQASPGLGATVSGRERFTNLLELCQSLALAGGTGFRVIQTSTGLLFSQYLPQTRADVLLSVDAGTLRSGQSSIQAPELTRALVAGQGEQEDRMLVERVDLDAEADWSARIERLIDARQSATIALLEQGGDEALLEGAATGSFQVVVQDTEDVVYGRDYRLGDVVPYITPRGYELADVVREVKITVQGGRTLVQPTIGPAGAESTPLVYKRLRVLERAVRSLRSN